MTLHFISGPQGAGKSTYALQLVQARHGLYFSIDAWMQALYGADLPQPLDPAWIMVRVQRCENLIWSLARHHVQLGGTAVLDLGLQKQADRLHFQQLADASGLPVQWHFVDAPLATRRQRVMARNTGHSETFAFVVTAPMFDYMEKQFERPTADELAHAIRIAN
ncbi:AAA family ATPase [Chitinilyticum litopenaei]|uniref:AAA family ATPase n=1 Tax=Chitinilyticum litopenaei TaxID=1121276 RepID=UPI000406919C|nr:AAA family ATPase [Chitinilyticum litopenaei]